MVAVVTEEPRLRMEWRGDEIVNLSRAFLDTNGVTQNAEARNRRAPGRRTTASACPPAWPEKTGTEALKENLARLEVCCQKGLSERFDSSIGAATVLMPFCRRVPADPRGGHGGQNPPGARARPTTPPP